MINKLKRNSIEVVKKINDILMKIYDYKNISDEQDINYIRIRRTLYGYRKGKKILYYNDGDRYEGDFKNNIREGKGIMYYNSGDKYEGDWKNDISEGKGIMYFNNGEIYEGNWKNDKFEGK